MPDITTVAFAQRGAIGRGGESGGASRAQFLHETERKYTKQGNTRKSKKITARSGTKQKEMKGYKITTYLWWAGIGGCGGCGGGSLLQTNRNRIISKRRAKKATATNEQINYINEQILFLCESFRIGYS